MDTHPPKLLDYKRAGKTCVDLEENNSEISRIVLCRAASMDKQ